MTTTTDLLATIRRLRELSDRATPGPWTVAKIGPSIWHGTLKKNTPGVTSGNSGAYQLFELDPIFYEESDVCDGDPDKAERLAKRDAKLIAALRNELPAILATLEGFLVASENRKEAP